ncbi:MAG: hypothetical protein SYC29_15865 [Planctomycetota bacterium]|nr:hypothetical protein [Planctomycetota bacterium]
MKVALSLTALLTLAALLAGCQAGNGSTVSYKAVSHDLTPELRGLEQRPIDVDAHLSYMINHNWRAMSDDLGRLFYTDHPSRLSPFPVTKTSGQPR